MAKLDTLYHYTTNAGLIGIVTRRKLWATSIRHLNDATEYHYAFGLLSDVLAMQTQRNSPELAKRVEELRRDIEPNMLEMVNTHVATTGTVTFVASFTEHSDQLSQWRAYCPGGGYSLGLSLDSLTRIADSLGGKLAPCIYDANSHIKVANDIARMAFERLTPNTQEDERYRIIADMHLQVGEHAPYWKHPSFHEEGEWRLTLRRPLSEALFRAGRSAVVPYIEINLENSPSDKELLSDAVKDIVIGPCAEPFLATGSAMMLFRASRVACSKYRPSVIPYRNW
jgi:hypothetical protein